MSYHHTKCHGKIRWFGFLPIPPKCKKCGKTWSFLVIYGPPRKDMYFEAPRTSALKGDTTYAKWGDRLPLAGVVASLLPSWPRKYRALAAAIVAGLASFLFYWFGWR